MKYEGGLYGRVDKNTYFPLVMTSTEVDTCFALLKEARDVLVMDALIDKSGQSAEMVEKIEKFLKTQSNG